jgi:protein SCO1/2
MRYLVPVALWLILLISFGVLAYFKYNQLYPKSTIAASTDPPGRFLTDTPWRHFQDVPPFQMKNQLGEIFDSRSLTGKPYLINFFFARCPVICREMNREVANINEQLREHDITFLSITVDPENDTPKVLRRYSEDFGATPPRWWFLTDQHYKIKQLGEQVFEVPISNNPQDHTHTEDLLLVDKWGRFRDRFRWSDPADVKRLIGVMQDVSAEAEPPLEKSFRTRNVVAGQPPVSLKARQWIREFHLVDSESSPFYSRELTGQVWICNFFYTRCQGTCPGQTALLKKLREQLGAEFPVVVSITSDPTFDTPDVLKSFGQALSADQRWKFCTGDSLLIQRIGTEFFGGFADRSNHDPKLYVIDRWHQLRGSFDWQVEGQEEAMLSLIRKLKQETRPVYELPERRLPPFAESGNE